MVVVRLLALAALVLGSPLALAQEAPVQVRLDAGTFAYGPDEALVEVYLSFGAATLAYETTAEGFRSDLPVTVRLLPVAAAAPEGAARQPVYEQVVTYQYAVADTASLTDGQVFVEQLRTLVAPGEYELAVEIAAPGRSAIELRRDLTVPDYEGREGTALSSIQLARDIARGSDPADPFYKSGLRVSPNPDAFYGGTVPALAYYAEVYGPPDSGDDYTLLAYLAESDQAGPMPDVQRRVERAVRPVDVVAGQLDVGTVPTGIYYLRLVVLDAANESVAEQSKRVYVINPDVDRPTAGMLEMDYEETLFAAMGEEELDQNVRHASVIATQRERQEIRALASDDDRRRFLGAFWRSRDVDGRDAVNSARRTFYERLAIVNDRYREPGKDGFETERGRVFLVYGPPSEIDRRTFDRDKHPHEVWTYESIPGEGRSLFVFADLYTSNTFELIHSTVTGETSSANWQQELQR